MKNNLKYQSFLFIALLCLALGFLPACKTASYDSGKAVSLMVDDSLGVDSTVLAMIEPYRLQIDSSMNIVIGVSSKALEKGTPESLLGNFCSDMILETVYSSFGDSLNGLPVMVLLNNGGLRTSLPVGNITISDIFRLMPFDNELVLIELGGAEMKRLLGKIAGMGGMPVAGVRLVLNATNLAKASFGTEAFDPNKHYFLATSDYLSNGGDGLDFLSVNFRYIKTGLLIRNIFIENIKNIIAKGKTINPVLDGRIRYE